MSEHNLRPRGRISLLALALLTSAITSWTCGTGAAYAGSWMEVSCVNPNQSAAPSQGWTSFAAGGGYGSNNSTSCGPGSPMFAILSSQAAVSVGSAETLQYTPPSGSTLIGGTIDVSMFADGGGFNASGTAVVYTPNYAYDGSDVVLQCASGLPPCANGTYDYAGAVPLPVGRGGNLYVSAGCGGAAGYACNAGGSEGAWSLVRLWWANLLLSNSATPSASNLSGTLLTPNARGATDLTFTAADPGGPGIYAVIAQIDGKAFYSGTPDNNGGACVPVGSSGSALAFDYNQPCRASESVDLPIDTAAVADGAHTLKVTLQDAAQNTSVIYNSTITTHNAPANSSPPTIIAPSQVFVGATLSTHPGAWSAPTGAGATSYAYQWQDCDTQANNCTAISAAQSATYTPTPSDIGHTLRLLITAADKDGSTSVASAATSAVLASQSSLGALPGTGTSSASLSGTHTGTGTANGSPAQENARLRLGIKQTLSRPFARRALKITGRLRTPDGHPIAGATLEVLQQTSGASTFTLIGHATTLADGSFTVRVPRGPSRLIEIGYRAFSGDTAYAAQVQIAESVGAGIRLHVTPRVTTPHGPLLITGRVLGRIPVQGILVHILIKYRGSWVPLRNTETDGSGYFHSPYTFQGALGRFPVIAEVPAHQANYPYARGYSAIVSIEAR